LESLDARILANSGEAFDLTATRFSFAARKDAEIEANNIKETAENILNEMVMAL
jgi:hypothetical protein